MKGENETYTKKKQQYTLSDQNKRKKMRGIQQGSKTMGQ